MEEEVQNSSPVEPEPGPCNAFTLSSLLSFGWKATTSSGGGSTASENPLVCYEQEEPVTCTSVVHTWLAPALASATTTAAAGLLTVGVYRASVEQEAVSNSHELTATPSSLSSQTLISSVVGESGNSVGGSRVAAAAASVADVLLNDAAQLVGASSVWKVSSEGRERPVVSFGSLFPSTHHPYHLQRYERSSVDFLLENVDPFSFPYMSLTNVTLEICEKLGIDWVSVVFLLAVIVLLRIGVVKCKVSAEGRLSSHPHSPHQERRVHHLWNCRRSKKKSCWMALPPSRTEPLCGLQRLIDTSLSFFWRRRPIVVKKKKDGAVTSMKDSEHRERRFFPSPPDICDEKERNELGRNNGRDRSNSSSSLTERQDSLHKSTQSETHRQSRPQETQEPQQEGRFRKGWIFFRTFITRGLKWSSNNNREVNNGRPSNIKHTTPAASVDKTVRVDESDRCFEQQSQSPPGSLGDSETQKTRRHKCGRNSDGQGETIEDIQSFNNPDDDQSLSSSAFIQLNRKKSLDDVGDKVFTGQPRIFTVSPQQSVLQVGESEGKEEEDEEEDPEEVVRSVQVVRRQVAPLVSDHYNNSIVPNEDILRKRKVCESLTSTDQIKDEAAIAKHSFVSVNEDCNSSHTLCSSGSNQCLSRSSIVNSTGGTTYLGHSSNNAAAATTSSASLQQRQPQRKVIVQLNEKIVLLDDNDDDDDDVGDEDQKENEGIKKKVEKGKGERELSPTFIRNSGKSKNASGLCTCFSSSSLVSSTSHTPPCTLATTKTNGSNQPGSSSSLATTTPSTSSIKTCSTEGSKDCSGLFTKPFSSSCPKSDNNILSSFVADDKSTQLLCAGEGV